jgi:hypothetical protein
MLIGAYTLLVQMQMQAAAKQAEEAGASGSSEDEEGDGGGIEEGAENGESAGAGNLALAAVSSGVDGKELAPAATRGASLAASAKQGPGAGGPPSSASKMAAVVVAEV